MKKTFYLALVLVGLSMRPASAQPGMPTIPTRAIIPGQPSESSDLSKFNLDFPGGTPGQLADAIEKSMGKPVNIIVPDEYASAKLPPLKVTGVTMPQLFQTLLDGSQKRSPRGDVISSYGFKSINGRDTDSTIWTFFVYNQNIGLATFNIDFPGGTPKELVAAIQKATGKSLNVIIPPEYADTKLPPLKMNSVNVDQLFRALAFASTKVDTSSPFMQNQRTSGYGFKTDGNITDDSIWYFYVDKPHADPGDKVSRFYSLAPFIEHGLKVDDITTAVETAWKMEGQKSPPEMSFHKDTKLLIAVGDPEKLKTIDFVLQALKPEISKPDKPAPAPEKKPAEAKPSESKSAE